MEPVFPAIDTFDNIYEVAYDSLSYDNIHVAAVQDFSKRRIYDRDGNVFRIEYEDSSVMHKSLWSSLTGYFRKNKTRPQWIWVRKYALIELQNLICQAIEDDDDILTQFVDPDDLKRQIMKSQDFSNIISICEQSSM